MKATNRGRLALVGMGMIVATAGASIGLVLDTTTSAVSADPCNNNGSASAQQACRASLKDGPRTFRVNDDGLGVQRCMAILDPSLSDGVDVICQ